MSNQASTAPAYPTVSGPAPSRTGATALEKREVAGVREQARGGAPFRHAAAERLRGRGDDVRGAGQLFLRRRQDAGAVRRELAVGVETVVDDAPAEPLPGRGGEGRPERRLDEQHRPGRSRSAAGPRRARPGPFRALGRGVAAREDPRAAGRRSEAASRRARRRPAPAARPRPGPSRRTRAARGAREPRRAAAGAGGGSSRRSPGARGRLRRRRAAVPDPAAARRSRRAACGSRAAAPDCSRRRNARRHDSGTSRRPAV